MRYEVKNEKRKERLREKEKGKQSRWGASQPFLYYAVTKIKLEIEYFSI